MAWRDIAAKLDADVVHTFDEGGCSLQPIVAGSPVGAPIPIPAEFDPAFVDQVIEDGQTVGIQRIIADIDLADLPDSTTIVPSWRFIIAGPNPNAGTYVVDSLETNNDKTGVRLRLKRQ
jgi:hypothetical protein